MKILPREIVATYIKLKPSLRPFFIIVSNSAVFVAYFGFRGPVKGVAVLDSESFQGRKTDYYRSYIDTNHILKEITNTVIKDYQLRGEEKTVTF